MMPCSSQSREIDDWVKRRKEKKSVKKKQENIKKELLDPKTKQNKKIE